MRAIIALTACLLAACGGGGDAAPDKPLKACSVQLLGDSTMASSYVGSALQDALDSRFGPGVAAVTVSAISGTTATDLVTGAAGYAPFPSSLTGDVIVANYGINDARAVPVADFTANMRKLADRGVILQTPIPTAVINTAAYADAVRAVGAGIDAEAWAKSQAGWTAMLPDGIHPDAKTSQRMATEAMAPLIIKAVNERCKWVVI